MWIHHPSRLGTQQLFLVFFSVLYSDATCLTHSHKGADVSYNYYCCFNKKHFLHTVTKALTSVIIIIVVLIKNIFSSILNAQPCTVNAKLAKQSRRKMFVNILSHMKCSYIDIRQSSRDTNLTCGHNKHAFFCRILLSVEVPRRSRHFLRMAPIAWSKLSKCRVANIVESSL